MYAWLEV
jgi:hypothetical protein